MVSASDTSSARELRVGPLGPEQRWSVARRREAVRLFAERYNAEWFIEKNGYLRPHEKLIEWISAQGEQAA